jgi:hypothetical protein
MNLFLEQKSIILELRIHFLSYTFTVTYLMIFFIWYIPGYIILRLYDKI